MGELILVVGPCGAGKTTWARATYPQHAHPDAEELARTLFATPDRFRYYPWVRAVQARMLRVAVEGLLSRRVPTVVTARGATVAERREWAGLAAFYETPARLVRLATPAEVCVERARSDSRRPRSSRPVWSGVVGNWFRDWEEPESGEGWVSVCEVGG